MDEKAEEQIRRKAVRLHLEGASATEVCRELGRSRKWFYEWKSRFEAGGAEWYKSRSRAPVKVANKTPEEIEKRVLEIRARLENSKYSQFGAFAIQWELEKLGIEPLPTWTIDRILKRHNAVREKKRYKPKNRDYPDTAEVFSESVQQADLLGPRYIKGDGRFYSMNVVDLDTHMAAVNPCRTKSDEDSARGLLHAWKTVGVPDFVQLDNAPSFHGSHRWPRSPGLVIRLCLALGVQVIFIPIGEPWRNGAVERFQQTFDKSFYRRQFFTSYAHLKREAAKFERFHNRYHRISALGGKTPMERVRSEGFEIMKLDRGVSLKDIDLSLSEGHVNLIRFIRSGLDLDVFGEKFKMPKEAKYEYVVATICARLHMLQVRLDGRIIRSFEYRMPVEYDRY